MLSSVPSLEVAFTKNGQAEGIHQVLNTPWEHFLSNSFGGFDFSKKIEAITRIHEDVAVLDEGCGSSATLFEVVEYLEGHKVSGSVNGFGITASTDYLAQPAPNLLQKKVLESEAINPESRHRVELLLGGVSVDAERGYHRHSPGGNLIRLFKADVHRLDEVFPNQQFNLIYSSSAYPHFASPRIAFEQSLHVLAKGGLLLIDSLPMADCPTDYLEQLQKDKPKFKITAIDINNPFYQAIVAERSTE